MSCLLKAIVLLSAVLSVCSVTLEDCKCWDDFVATERDDGKVVCSGKRLFVNKPCNMPDPPECVCTQDVVTAILTDLDGTWCSISESGELIKKWACENEDEWAVYKIQYAEFLENYQP